MLPRARHLFDVALEKSWDDENGGMHYTFAPDGTILDRDRYYWVLSETFAAAAALALRTGDDSYWDWYDKAWTYSDKHCRSSRVRRMVPDPGCQQSEI